MESASCAMADVTKKDLPAWRSGKEGDEFTDSPDAPGNGHGTPVSVLLIRDVPPVPITILPSSNTMPPTNLTERLSCRHSP
jgi:hypothetical protein